MKLDNCRTVKEPKRYKKGVQKYVYKKIVLFKVTIPYQFRHNVDQNFVLNLIIKFSMDSCNQKPEHTYVQYICEYDEEACIICVMYARVPHTMHYIRIKWNVVRNRSEINRSIVYLQCTS